NGKLVSEPCSLDSGSQFIPISHGNIVSKYFYLTPRTPGVEFNINLIDCDISLGTQATVTFVGRESIALPGYLIPDDGDTHGIAFGIETMKGDLVPMNQASPIFTLSDGTNELKLKGFIRAEQDAIDKQTILAGPFTGTATFEINYP
ncbi:MAG: fimbrial protein, partial [Acinetobacter sp.]